MQIYIFKDLCTTNVRRSRDQRKFRVISLFSLPTFLYIPFFTNVCVTLVVRKVNVLILCKESQVSFPRRPSVLHSMPVCTVRTPSPQ